jgi:hypothetical protein
MKRKLSQVRRKDIARALGNKSWDFGNKVLYSLCQKHPCHKRADVVIAKVWLIGRSYSAAIERRRQPTSDVGSFYVDVVAREIIDSKIDRWLKLVPVSASLGSATQNAAITVHGRLTNLFGHISKQQKRSLASKYLHFHRPNIFFLYDSRAAAAIRSVARPVHQPDPAAADSEYASFYRRCLSLQHDLQHQYGRALTPREIDKVLLYLGDSKRLKR